MIYGRNLAKKSYFLRVAYFTEFFGGYIMDKIQQLHERKAEIEKVSKDVRESITALIDEDSFVEFCP